MPKAIRMRTTGGPSVLQWEDVPIGIPQGGEVHLRHSAVGLNFIDVYHRTGLYPLPGGFPATPGMEGAGVVVDVAADVAEFRPGDRVAYAGMPPGAYAEERLIPAHRLVKLPDAIDERQAAAMMLQGMTAQYLLRRTYRVKAGDVILIHAAAGGVGLIACQWAKYLGATVIGTVGSQEKAALAKAHGCDYPLLYRDSDWVAQVREITSGEGVAAVYDSVGRDTFCKSLDCLRPLGILISFGQSSGPVDPIDSGILAVKGSLYLTRPTLMTYTANREDLLATAAELFDVVMGGAVKIEVNQTYPLREASRAQADMESRRTTGSTILIP
jgi:NADPH2:quinone reductase